MITTRSPVRSARHSSRSSSRVHATSEQATFARMPARLVRQPAARSHCVIVPSEPSPARKPGISSTPRPVARGHARAAEDVRAPQASPLQAEAALAPERGQMRLRQQHELRLYAHRQHVADGSTGGRRHLGSCPASLSRRRRRTAHARVRASRPCAPRRSATARSPSREHPDPGAARSASCSCACAPRGSTAPTCSSSRARYPAPPGSPPDIPGLELAGEVVAVGPRRQPLRARRPRDGGRRRRRPGGAGRRARARRDAGAGGARLDRGRRRPRGVHDRARRALHPGRADRRRARCSCTAPRAASAWPRCSSRTMAGARVTATVRDRPRASRSPRSACNAIEPDGFEAHGPFDVVLELVGAPNMPATWPRSPSAAGSA